MPGTLGKMTMERGGLYPKADLGHNLACALSFDKAPSADRLASYLCVPILFETLTVLLTPPYGTGWVRPPVPDYPPSP